MSNNHFFTSTFLILYFLSLNGQSQLADSMYAIGDVHYFDNNYSLARKAYLKATALHQKSDTVPISVIYNDIGLTYLISGFADSALYYYEIAFNLDMQRSDYVQASRRLRSMGNIHRERGEFEIALRFYHRAFDLVSDKEEIAEMAAYTMSIGNVFYEQEEYTKALQYYKESYSYYQRVNRPNKTMLILNNLGNVYLSLTEVDSAFSFLRDAESLKDALGETRSLAYTYHSLARTHLLVDQRDSALHYFKQAYSIRSRIKDERGKATTAIELADMYLTLSNPDESLTYLRVAGEYAKNQSNRTILMDYLRLKAKYYEVIGQYQIALDTFMKWSNIRDSIFNEEKVKVLAKQSEQELEKKEAERSLASQKARNQLIISWTLTAIGVIVIVALYLIVRQSRKIDALNRSLELLNRDMYHRKRNDYHRIMDLLDRSNFPASDSVKNMLFASSSVDDALYHESIESTNIREYLELLITDLTDSLQLSEKGISIQHSITSVLLNQETAARLGFVISELITNNIKHSFSESGGTIHLSFERKKQKLYFSHRDNGRPFPEDLPKDSQGLGLGLINGFLASMKTQMTREFTEGWNEARFVISLG